MLSFDHRGYGRLLEAGVDLAPFFPAPELGPCLRHQLLGDGAYQGARCCGGGGSDWFDHARIQHQFVHRTQQNR
ncbi:hypothetical protein ACGFYP_02810 [Streptomyces sp. NPDC048370]|uniref:hypothetical protein n=1 Tax=Streptomyces sp. NPDC048370 TaxID=3365540 RepID=UPI003710968E